MPLPEPISSLAIVGSQDAPATLAIGMKSGRLTLWEVGIKQIVLNLANQALVAVHRPISIYSAFPLGLSEMSCSRSYLELSLVGL